MTKKKSFLILFAIIGLSALVFTQCLGTGGSGAKTTLEGQSVTGPDTAGDAADSGGKSIKAAVSMGPEEFEIFSSLAKLFSDSHEDVNIQVENVSANEAYAKWKKAAQMGEAPDLMLLDNNWVEEFAALGFLQPVDEFFSSEQQNGRISYLMDQVKWNGYIWGIPKDVDPYILAWNKQKAAEGKLEQAPQTPEELAAWNKALLNPDEAQYGIYSDPVDPYAFIALASSLTGAWLAPDKLWENAVSAQELLEKFLAPQEEAWAGKAYPRNFPQPSATWDPWSQLLSGRIGAMVTTVSAFKTHETNQIAIAAIPAQPDKEAVVWLKGRSFAISSRSAYAKLLMDWIKEMTQPETEIRYWNESKLMPAQIPSYSLAPLRGDAHIQSFNWLIQQGKVLPVAAETPKNITALQQELLRLYKGEQNMKEFVEAIGKAWIFPAKSKS